MLVRGHRCGGGHADPVLVQAERRVGVGHQGGVRDDPHHPAVHADDEVILPSRVAARPGNVRLAFPAAPARMADALRLLAGPLQLLPPRPAAFAPPARPPNSGAASACAPGSVYNDRFARSCVMPSICPAASLSNW